MQFTLKCSQIGTQDFNNGLKKLYTAKFSAKHVENYRLMRLIDKIGGVQKTFQEQRAALGGKYDKLPPEDKTKPETIEAFQKEMDALGNTEVVIEWHMLRLEDLNGVSLSPAELQAIECLFPVGEYDKFIKMEEDERNARTGAAAGQPSKLVTPASQRKPLITNV